MTETITERVANINSESCEDVNVTQIAQSIMVDRGVVYFTTLKENKYKIGSLRYIAQSECTELINKIEDKYNVSITESVQKQIEELLFSVRRAWDEEIKMFRIDYDLNSKGQIHNFYIPFDSNLIDDIELFKIYNEEGEFVAQDIEKNLGRYMFKIESSELYIRNIPDKNETFTVYRTVRKDKETLYKEFITENTSFNSTIGALTQWTYNIFIGVLVSILYFMLGLPIFFILCAGFIFPSMYVKLFRVFIIPIQLVYYYNRSRKKAGIRQKQKFFKTNIN
jgi:hypothetical protein